MPGKGAEFGRLARAAAQTARAASHAEPRAVIDALLLNRHQNVIGLFEKFVDAIEGIPFTRAAIEKFTVVAGELRGFILNIEDLERFFRYGIVALVLVE